MTEALPQADDMYVLRLRIRGETLRKLREKAMADRRDVQTYAALVLERFAETAAQTAAA